LIVYVTYKKIGTGIRAISPVPHGKKYYLMASAAQKFCKVEGIYAIPATKKMPSVYH
jgi:hypothetical protein